MFTNIVFFISFVFIIGAVIHFLAIKKPGMYPPKRILRKRAHTLAAAGGVFLLIGIISLTFQ